MSEKGGAVVGDIGIVLLLLALNGFFAMAELALVSSRPARLRLYAEERRKGAREALAIATDPTSFLSVVQIGVTLNSLLVGAFSGHALAEPLAELLRQTSLSTYADTVAMTLTMAGATYLSLVLGELLPKRIGIAYPELIALRVARFMVFMARLVAPVVWLLRLSTETLFRLLGFQTQTGSAVTEEEVKDMIAEGTQSGVFKPDEKSMIEGVMRLADRSVRTIMTPRIDMVWLSIEDQKENQIKEMRASGYSRFPVAHGDLEQVVGVVHAKDMMNALFDHQSTDLAVVMRPPLIVPDTTSVLRLLDHVRQTRQHVAIVVDEYGSVEGLVTVTDILEAITGALPDAGQEAPGKPVQRKDGSWLIDGMTPIDEVEMLIGLKSMQGSADYHTLAGFMIDHLGRIPAAGDGFDWDGARFEVVDMDARRVDKVLVYPPTISADQS